MDNPSKITEGGVEYSLGKFDGHNVNYDFRKILFYLNAKGKLLFGKQFKIYDQDKDIVFKLCNYFVKDRAYCQKEGIDPNKGILLSGPVGVLLMNLLHYLVVPQWSYCL